MKYATMVLGGLLAFGLVLVMGHLALGAFEYEQDRVRAQVPEGCVVHADGSATCQDEDGGWHFEVSPWNGGE